MQGTSRHTYSAEIDAAGQQVPAEIVFDFDPGLPLDRDDPASPPEAIILSAKIAVDGVERDAPADLIASLTSDADMQDELVGFAVFERRGIASAPTSPIHSSASPR